MLVLGHTKRNLAHNIITIKSFPGTHRIKGIEADLTTHEVELEKRSWREQQGTTKDRKEWRSWVRVYASLVGKRQKMMMKRKSKRSLTWLVPAAATVTTH